MTDAYDAEMIARAARREFVHLNIGDGRTRRAQLRAWNPDSRTALVIVEVPTSRVILPEALT